MNKISVLDPITIDKIAAGEVIERPASIVKELVENAIDAGATHLTVSIHDGGISEIQVTDNGSGIWPEQVKMAFLRHATSKILTIEDLYETKTLGFRGEALSSIAAVSQVELITKRMENSLGVRYELSGGKEVSFEEIGAPNGTTFYVRQIFFNTPARRKFLKTAVTEAGHIGEMLNKLAIANPNLSLTFFNNGIEKLHTSGNGNLKEVIYQIYGREIASNLVEVNVPTPNGKFYGFIGLPVISRGNRNFEHYIINGRYVKNSVVSKAIEDGYKDYMMQHRYPFTAIFYDVDTKTVDVNVHPGKLEVRFENQQKIYQLFYELVKNTLWKKEQIPEVEVSTKEEASGLSNDQSFYTPGFTSQSGKNVLSSRYSAPLSENAESKEKKLHYFLDKMKERVFAYHQQQDGIQKEKTGIKNSSYDSELSSMSMVQEEQKKHENAFGFKDTQYMEKPGEGEQIKLDIFRKDKNRESSLFSYRLIGQVFETYWLVEFEEQLYIIDQHAAHERVLYERTMNSLETREYPSQMVSPPMVLTLTMKEQQILETYMVYFQKIGFLIEPFGSNSYAIRGIPDNLFSISKKELFIEMLDGLENEISSREAADMITEKVASMSCKAAVKGNSKLSEAEMDALLKELLVLENPYHCPHGRPTIISMTKKELEKKFKRIV